MSRLSLSQIRDLHQLPQYLTNLDQLAISDNNLVLNDRHGGTAVGSGLIIKRQGTNDITFTIVNLDGLTCLSPTQSEYQNSSGWGTEVSDIVLSNTCVDNPNGLRVLKEGDFITPNTDLSFTTRRSTYLHKKFSSTPVNTSLTPGEIGINSTTGDLYTLKQNGSGWDVVTVGQSSSSITTNMIYVLQSSNYSNVTTNSTSGYTTGSYTYNVHQYSFNITEAGLYRIGTKFTYLFSKDDSNAVYAWYLNSEPLGSNGYLYSKKKNDTIVCSFDYLTMDPGTYTFQLRVAVESSSAPIKIKSSNIEIFEIKM